MRLPPPPFVYPILDAGVLGGRSAVEAARSLVGAGARLLQVRGKDLSGRDLLALVVEVVAVAHAGGALVIVNDRPDVALAGGADGVHVGQDDLPPADARRVLPRPMLIGLSTHASAQLALASDTVLDYVAIGPVFATRTKANPDPVIGLAGVAAARAATGLPLVAIGGITRANAAAVVRAGADGVAVASALLATEDVGGAMRAMQSALHRGV